jgi:hypothetical protein
MSDSATPQDPQELRAEIEQTRADLGETVEALAAKTDVKARAKDAAGNVADRAKEQAGKAADAAKDAAASVHEHIADVPSPARRPMPWALIGAGVAAVAGVAVLVRRRRS